MIAVTDEPDHKTRFTITPTAVKYYLAEISSPFWRLPVLLELIAIKNHLKQF